LGCFPVWLSGYKTAMAMIHSKRERHPVEGDLLRRGLRYDTQAVNSLLKYLSSSDPRLCKSLQEAIHDLNNPTLWYHLLYSLAFHRWDDLIVFDRHLDPNNADRFDQAIIEVFVQDDCDKESPIKEAVLHEALDNQINPLRHAAACLLGQRNDPRAIPVLSETIETDSMKWKLRAVKALAALNEVACARSLMEALVLDRGELHREARRALQNLGRLAEPVWLEALNHLDEHIRWEAARGLGEIGDIRAVDTLAEGLLDDSYAVRWATADVLAHLGERAIPSVLLILNCHTMNEYLRKAAIHALHMIRSRKIQRRIQPLLDALHGSAAEVEVPVTANQLLADWDEK